MTMRMRVTELKFVKAAELVPHQKNWRQHPLEQVNLLKSEIESIGFTTALLGYMRADGKIGIIDGHMRAGMLPNEIVPVIMTDLTDDEAEEMLLMADGLASMAIPKPEKIQEMIDTAKKDISKLVTAVPNLNRIIEEGKAKTANIPKPSRTITCPDCGYEFEA